MSKIWSHMIAHPGVFMFMTQMLERLFHACVHHGVIYDVAVHQSGPTCIDVAIKPTSTAQFYVFFVTP